MKVKSKKLKVKSCFRKLFTSHFSLLTCSRGFTLIEIIMIIVIVAIAIPTLLIVLGQGAKQGVNAELEIKATNVAQAMMEEIRSKRWGAYTSPPGPEVGESRTACTGTPNTFDDVDDYNGYSETCTWGGPDYTTDVVVCYVDVADLNNCVAGPTDYKRIEVTVSNPNIGPVKLVTVVTNY